MVEAPAKERIGFWSEGGQIFFLYGKAFGVIIHGTEYPKELKTVCIGTEEEILKALQNNTSTGNSRIDNILTMELNYRGTSETPPRAPVRRHTTGKKRHKTVKW